MKLSNFFITFFLSILFFVFGVLFQKLILNKYFADIEKNKQKELNASIEERKFTNPLLKNKEKFYYISPNLEKVITEKTAFYKKNRSVTQVSVFFSLLNNDTWYGVDEKEIYSVSGLNKMALLVATFKLSEENSEILKYKFSFDENTNTFKKIDTTEITDNTEKALTIYDVMDHMVKNTDNIAAIFLNDLLNTTSPKIVERVFLDLGIKLPNNKGIQELTVKNYITFFNVLYNSTYLNGENSEMALNFLSQTDFNEGLVKGLEENTLISHSYGQSSEGKLIQINDYGIIYLPGCNYFFGIIVKGYDVNQMNITIQEISKAVYQEVKNQIPNTL